jgi:hypothetical protein
MDQKTLKKLAAAFACEAAVAVANRGGHGSR